MTSQPRTAAPPPGSARELVKAMRERNAPRRAEVLRHVESLRRIAEQLAGDPSISPATSRR